MVHSGNLRIKVSRHGDHPSISGLNAKVLPQTRKQRPSSLCFIQMFLVSIPSITDKQALGSQLVNIVFGLSGLSYIVSSYF